MNNNFDMTQIPLSPMRFPRCGECGCPAHGGADKTGHATNCSKFVRPPVMQLVPTTRAIRSDERNALAMLKRSAPFRIVWGCIDNHGLFTTHADYTKRQMNAALRKGYSVFLVH